MEIHLESTFCLSNNDCILSKYDSLMMTFINTTINLDISETFSEEDWALFDEKGEIPEPIKIGHIYAYRFDLSYHPDDLMEMADCAHQDLSYFASYFLLEEGNDLKSYNHLFYLHEVFIDPKYRGMDYALQALAIFLQGFARGETVGCHPAPLHDLSKKYAQNQGRKLMRKYWSKLGLDRYSEKHNILWTEEWYMPEWLKNKIFES